MAVESSDDGGWTVVPRSKGRVPKLSEKRPPLDKSATPDKLKSNYDRWMRVWQASSCRKEVLQIIDRKRPDEGWQIKIAICLASGSFSRDNWECQKRAMCQLVAFMDIVQHFHATDTENIDIIAQELIYTPVDVEFLSSMGMTVYNNPDIAKRQYKGASAMDHTGPHSFVFEPFMDKLPLAMKPLLTSDVRLFIGTSPPSGLAAHNKSDADLRAGLTSDPDRVCTEHDLNRHAIENSSQIFMLYKQFQAVYSSYRFPRFEEDPNIFEGLMIFWKEPKDEDENG